MGTMIYNPEHPDLILLTKDMIRRVHRFSSVKDLPMSMTDMKYYFTEIVKGAEILLREALYFYNELPQGEQKALDLKDRERNSPLLEPKARTDVIKNFYARQDEIFEELLEKYSTYYDEREYTFTDDNE